MTDPRKLSGGESIRLRIMQDGQEVAAVEGPEEAAISSAMHYAMMYAQDGKPASIDGRDDRSRAALVRAFVPPPPEAGTP